MDYHKVNCIILAMIQQIALNRSTRVKYQFFLLRNHFCNKQNSNNILTNTESVFHAPISCYLCRVYVT